MLTESECLLSLMQRCAVAIFAERREIKPLFAPRVKAHIIERLATRKHLDMDVTAKAFCISTSNLRWRLRQENTNYQRLVDEVRFDMAKKMLLQGMLVQDIAESLDYSMPAAFSRAFKEWCGLAPQNWIEINNASGRRII